MWWIWRNLSRARDRGVLCSGRRRTRDRGRIALPSTLCLSMRLAVARTLYLKSQSCFPFKTTFRSYCSFRNLPYLVLSYARECFCFSLNSLLFFISRFFLIASCTIDYFMSDRIIPTVWSTCQRTISLRFYKLWRQKKKWKFAVWATLYGV